MSAQGAISKIELLERMEQGWNELQTCLKAMTTEQLTQLTDAQGWTVKDHVMHLAIWEDSVQAAMHRQSQRERLGIDEALWKFGEYDAQNAVTQQRYKDMPFEAVLKALNDAHQLMIETIQTLTDADLQRPYRDYQPDSPSQDSALSLIASDTYEHYDAHIPWMQAIAAQALR